MENKQALSYVIGVAKKSDQSKSDVLWKLHKVYVIIVTQYFETFNQFPKKLSKQNSMVKSFVTVSQMCPNRPVFIRNGLLTYRKDFESKVSKVRNGFKVSLCCLYN